MEFCVFLTLEFTLIWFVIFSILMLLQIILKYWIHFASKWGSSGYRVLSGYRYAIRLSPHGPLLPSWVNTHLTSCLYRHSLLCCLSWEGLLYVHESDNHAMFRRRYLPALHVLHRPWRFVSHPLFRDLHWLLRMKWRDGRWIWLHSCVYIYKILNNNGNCSWKTNFLKNKKL